MNVRVYYPNGTLLNNGSANLESTGRFNYTFSLANDTPLGTYSIDFDGNYSGNNVFRNLVFQVVSATSGGAGGLALNIFNTVGSTYEPGDTVRISSTVVNSSGALVNATVNVYVYNPDGTPLNNGTSTLQSAGRYEYSFVAPSTQGTYTADIDANYSGDEIHDTEAFIIAVGGAAGGNLSTPPRVFVEAPTVVGLNTNFSITMLSTDDAGLAADCTTNTANLTIRDTISGTELVSNQPMTKFGTGLYNYTYSASSASSYVAIAKCTLGGLEYVGITTFSTQGFSITGGNIVELKGFDEVVADKQYRTKLWIFDVNGNPINADSTPKVTLYDANRNLVVTDASMTFESTGIYYYNYTTSSGQIEGDWETIVNVTVNGVTIYPSEFWDLVGGIFDVRDIVIDNSAVNALQISVTTENKGGAAKDLTLQWKLTRTDTDEELDMGADTFAVNAFSERVWTIYPTTSYVGPVKILFLGTYSGTEKAGAFKLFSTTSAVIAPAPSAPAGAGGEGGIPYEKPSVLNVDVNILAKYLEIFAGEEVAAEITVTDFSFEKTAKDIILEYFIQDSNGKIYVSQFEEITLNEKLKVLKELKTSEEISKGKYLFVARVRYKNTTAVGEGAFNIKKEGAIKIPPVEEIIGKMPKLLLMLMAIILCLTIFIIILLLRRGRSGIERKISRITDDMHKLEVLYNQGIIKHSSYERKYRKLSNKLRNLRIRSMQISRKRQDLNKLVSYINEEV